MRDRSIEQSLMSVKLIVYVTGDGRLMPDVLHRTRRGREVWDRRLTPAVALEAPPAPPPGADPTLWMLHYCAQELLIRQLGDRTPRRGAPPESPRGDYRGDGESQ